MSSSHSYFQDTQISMINGLGEDRRGAWDTFFRIYGPIVHRFARHAGLGEHDADDVLANVMRSFLVCVQNGFKFDPAKGRFRYYLRTMTNHAITELRRKKGRQAVDIEQIGEVEDLNVKTWDGIDRQERLRACKERLRESGLVSDRDLLAFEMYAERDMPADEVARRLGISTSRLYVIKHEVITHLRQMRHQLAEILGEV